MTKLSLIVLTIIYWIILCLSEYKTVTGHNDQVPEKRRIARNIYKTSTASIAVHQIEPQNLTAKEAHETDSEKPNSNGKKTHTNDQELLTGDVKTVGVRENDTVSEAAEESVQETLSVPKTSAENHLSEGPTTLRSTKENRKLEDETSLEIADKTDSNYGTKTALEHSPTIDVQHSISIAQTKFGTSENTKLYKTRTAVTPTILTINDSSDAGDRRVPEEVVGGSELSWSSESSTVLPITLEDVHLTHDVDVSVETVPRLSKEGGSTIVAENSGEEPENTTNEAGSNLKGERTTDSISSGVHESNLSTLRIIDQTTVQIRAGDRSYGGSDEKSLAETTSTEQGPMTSQSVEMDSIHISDRNPDQISTETSHSVGSTNTTTRKDGPLTIDLIGRISSGNVFLALVKLDPTDPDQRQPIVAARIVNHLESSYPELGVRIVKATDQICVQEKKESEEVLISTEAVAQPAPPRPVIVGRIVKMPQVQFPVKSVAEDRPVNVERSLLYDKWLCDRCRKEVTYRRNGGWRLDFSICRLYCDKFYRDK